MEATEYENLKNVEEAHWYYAGKREIARRWLQRARRIGPEEVLLDCGAGTGRFAKDMEALCRVLVLDDHEESLRYLRGQFRDEQVIALTGGDVPLPNASIDRITALDVLEHVPEDASVVRGFHRLLKPGGVVLVTVPADMALWSDWDVSLHHFRRYGREQLRQLFPDESWQLVYLNYTNFFAYPVAWFLRRIRRKNSAQPSGNRMEDRLPPRWLNWILRRLFVAPAFWRVPLPFGVSLLLVARRRD